MANQTRERMIEGALRLLAEKGLQRASFHEVTQATGTPRGSIYYHFPGGKSEMVSEALTRNLNNITAQVDEVEAATPLEFVEQFFEIWRDYLVRNEFRLGCAAAAVAMAAEDDTQTAAARASLTGSVEAVEKKLASLGLDAADAQHRARTVVTAIEGGILMARGEGHIESYDAIRDALLVTFRD